MDLDLTLLPLLKQERRQAGADAQGKLYTKVHPSQTGHHYSVMGNPSLVHIRNMMIGLRNNRGEERSIEVWVDELRLSEAQRQGDYALNGQITLNVSSLGQTLISMSHRGAGFGAIDERIDIGTSSQTDRLLIQGNLDVGQLLRPKSRPLFRLLIDTNKARQALVTILWTMIFWSHKAVKTCANKRIRTTSKQASNSRGLISAFRVRSLCLMTLPTYA